MKMIKHWTRIGLLTVIASLSGCASQPSLDQQQVMNQYPDIAKLNSALEQARANNAQLLAAEGYTNASNALIRAMNAAENNASEVANAEASGGLKAVDKLNRDTSLTREILAEVLQARDKAYEAGADKLPGGMMGDLDIDLKRTATMIEDGQIEKAKKRRPGLINAYGQLHLKALKQNTMKLAESSLTEARRQGADSYAPKTLTQAEQEMKLAVSILNADRTQTDKANKHAQKAKWLAERSAAISETVKDFNRRDYSMEDIVLWHQRQLETINEPLGTSLPFNQSDDKATISLRNDIARIINERNMVRAQMEETQQHSQAQLQSAEKRIAGLVSQSQAEKQKEQEERKKFRDIRGMFNNAEANVFQQGKNIIISAHGFQFPPGQSEIEANNFPLLNKITRAINTFPKAYIEVSGHTDSMGNDQANQLLSEVRAEKVAQFLNEVGGIAVNRIMSNGYGESRPLASNDTREGRAENRRVEIKIINE